jgi:hypothetical protein
MGAAALALHTEDQLEVKDFIGYVTGFVVTVLAWRLHTCVHKGLVQMWRYTKGLGTCAKDWYKPRPAVAEAKAPGR